MVETQPMTYAEERDAFDAAFAEDVLRNQLLVTMNRRNGDTVGPAMFPSNMFGADVRIDDSMEVRPEGLHALTRHHLVQFADGETFGLVRLVIEYQNGLREAKR